MYCLQRVHEFIFICALFFCALYGCYGGSDAPVFHESNRKPGTADAPVKTLPADILATQQAFSMIAKKVTPCVANVSAVGKKSAIQPFFELSPFFKDFFDSPQYRQNKSLGSGFIISKDGYIVTNEHVVRDAETVQVKLSNDKVYDATVVGGDRKTDIAVIKIKASDLPIATLGDSDKLEVGQWAIAIGNPFGLDRTMTVGVVSATGRSNMGIETYENFIQTDASINPGNSGGPLLNIYGEVIGINTAIVASGQGIGFAIPISMAKPIVAQLISKGSVSRGWMGVSLQPVTEELAEYFKLRSIKGALISDVMSGSPAEKAGVRQGDVITSFDGSEVKDPSHLQRLVAEAGVGKSVKITVVRDGKLVHLSMALANADSVPQSAVEDRRSREYPDPLGLIVESAQGGGAVITEIG